LVEKEVSFVKIQHRQNGVMMVTIPTVASHLLHFEEKERLKVIVDVEKNKLIYV